MVVKTSPSKLNLKKESLKKSGSASASDDAVKPKLPPPGDNAKL
jgi:hypothetical protein